jgi:hypothetical protein
MAAPKGNSFWKDAESPLGRKKAYLPESLWNKFIEYIEKCEANPWYKNEAIKGGDMAGAIVQIPTSRPFTISGFSVHAGISVQTFDSYSKTEEFLEVTTRIRDIIFTQKFEGAAVGAYNANLISRDLQLIDQKKLIQEEQPRQITGFKIIRKEEPSGS